MIGTTISHYSALWNSAPERNLPLFVPLFESRSHAESRSGRSRKSSGILKGGIRKRDKIFEKSHPAPCSGRGSSFRPVGGTGLGVGGLSVVHKAEDTALKQTVALKFLPPDLTRDEDAKERFIREAQAASALDHPNSCNVHEIS